MAPTIEIDSGKVAWESDRVQAQAGEEVNVFDLALAMNRDRWRLIPR